MDLRIQNTMDVVHTSSQNRLCTLPVTGTPCVAVSVRVVVPSELLAVHVTDPQSEKVIL